MFEQEVTVIYGDNYRPSESCTPVCGSEIVTIRITAGKELIAKRRVRETLPSGLEREVRVKSYGEVKRRKGMFDEVLESKRLVDPLLAVSGILPVREIIWSLQGLLDSPI